MQRKVSIWVVIACILLMILVFGITNASIAADIQKIKDEKATVDQNCTDLINTKTELENELELAGTDAFIEQYARDYYDCMMEGELRFVISFPEETAGDNQPSL